jgi:hypothetical protein
MTYDGFQAGSPAPYSGRGNEKPPCQRRHGLNGNAFVWSWANHE